MSSAWPSHRIISGSRADWIRYDGIGHGPWLDCYKREGGNPVSERRGKPSEGLSRDYGESRSRNGWFDSFAASCNGWVVRNDDRSPLDESMPDVYWDEREPVAADGGVGGDEVGLVTQSAGCGRSGGGIRAQKENLTTPVDNR